MTWMPPDGHASDWRWSESYPIWVCGTKRRAVGANSSQPVRRNATSPEASAETRLTILFVIQVIPLIRRIPCPGAWSPGSSDRAPHVTQRNLACRVAPRIVSTELPSTPHTPMITACSGVTREDIGAIGDRMTARMATNMAPATEAMVPAAETAPDVPGGTLAPVRIDRGVPPMALPISVAQVSDVVAAIVDAAATSRRPSKPARPIVASARAGPPFAATWCQAREGAPDPLSGSNADERKKASRIVPSHQPPVATSDGPRMVAATVPPRSSRCRRCATSAMVAAIAAASTNSVGETAKETKVTPGAAYTWWDCGTAAPARGRIGSAVAKPCETL